MSDDEPGDPASKSAAGSMIDGPTMRFPGAGLVEVRGCWGDGKDASDDSGHREPQDRTAASPAYPVRSP